VTRASVGCQHSSPSQRVGRVLIGRDLGGHVAQASRDGHEGTVINLIIGKDPLVAVGEPITCSGCSWRSPEERAADSLGAICSQGRGHVRVAAGDPDVGVTEQLLDDSERRPLIQPMVGAEWRIACVPACGTPAAARMSDHFCQSARGSSGRRFS